MIVRGLDANGDWLFGKGKNDYNANNKAIEQSIKTRLQSFLGDCFFALDAGLDWFNLLGSKNQLALELAVRSVILNTPNVSAIIDVSINLDHNTRRILMQYTVETVFTNNNTVAPIQSTASLILTEGGDVLVTEGGSSIEAG